MKKNLLVLFGGVSSEHDISRLSVLNVIENINEEKYNVTIVGITKNGRWIYVNNKEEIETKSWIYGDKNAYIIPDAEKRALMIVKDDEKGVDTKRIDLCFPVLHGEKGEDGTIQGLLELAKIPYVGCNVLSSAICLDKITTKKLIEHLGISQAPYLTIEDGIVNSNEMNRKIKESFGYPVFVKPANCGSSVGVTRVCEEDKLEEALLEAIKYDSRIIIEKEIVGRELECAVFKGEKTIPLGVGEIIADGCFYDFDAKYNSPKSKTVVDPKLPDGKKQEIFDLATRAFNELACSSLSRVDFFLEEGTNKLIFNEINTMPGFTDISMYPMLAQSSGISSKELINLLLESASLKR